MRTRKAEELTRLLLEHRQFLLAYVYTLVLDHHVAEDVLQETAVTLIQRAEDFGTIKHFWLLAREIARRHALAAMRKHGRPPHCLSLQAVEALGAGFDDLHEGDRWDAEHLKHCLAQLPASWQKVIELRYWLKFPVRRIADELGRSASAVSVTLNRARARLADCVTHQARLGEAR